MEEQLRMEGWLHKRGDGLFKRWHPRWTTLIGETLSFYKGPGGGEAPIRILRMDEIQSVDPIGSEEFGRALCLICKSGPLVLRADTTDDMHRWFTTIIAVRSLCGQEPSPPTPSRQGSSGSSRRGSECSNGSSRSRRGSCCMSEISYGDHDHDHDHGDDGLADYEGGNGPPFAQCTCKQEIFEAGVEVLKDILTAESEVDVDHSHMTASTTLHCDKFKFVTVFAVFTDDDEHMFGFIAAFLYKCPSKRRDLMSELILQLNHGLLFGYLDLDLDDGQLSFKTYVDFKGYPLVDACKLLRPALCDALRVARNFFPAAEGMMFHSKSLGETMTMVNFTLGPGNNMCDAMDRSGDLKKSIGLLRAEMPLRTPRSQQPSTNNNNNNSGGPHSPRRFSAFAA